MSQSTEHVGREVIYVSWIANRYYTRLQLVRRVASMLQCFRSIYLRPAHVLATDATYPSHREKILMVNSPNIGNDVEYR